MCVNNRRLREQEEGQTRREKGERKERKRLYGKITYAINVNTQSVKDDEHFTQHDTFFLACVSQEG